MSPFPCGQLQDLCGTKTRNFGSVTHLNAVLGSLKEIQSGHTKGSTIQYDKLATQPYLNSSCFSKQERSTLFNLRAETQNVFKACFSSIYKDNLKCQLGCLEDDTLGHIYICPIVNQHVKPTHLRISDIYKNVQQQQSAVLEFITRENTRSVLLKADPASQGETQVLDTSTPATEAARGAAGSQRDKVTTWTSL